MRLITIDRCQPGLKLGKTIFNCKGKVLLAEGTELTSSLITGLKKYNIFTIHIEDEASEGIDIVESIPDELRNEAVNVITESLDTIADLKTTNLRGMMKSQRAIRSFQKIFRDILSCLTETPVALNLLATTKIHENHLYSHSLNTTVYACQLAIANGLPIRNIEEIGLGAMLHDIGKVYISKEILNKPGALTPEEYEHIKNHSELGFEILRKVYEIPLTVAHCAYQHHERIDGTGYPRALSGENIHKYAKIVSVADVFDAVTSHRVYRPSLLPHQGLELLYSGSGTQFEPKQIELFEETIAIYPEGLTVKLNDGRIGIVSKYNYQSVRRPEVRIIRDEENQDIPPYELDLAANENVNVKIIEADALL
ncbi:MAG: HD-GYP domain-containing protein [Anaerobacillus sp.]|uniref:HD-GYP domain-containing protein n=1 Tax=Anaerobacillus sp. TaxID=1872506 RepID=UPI00391A55E0